MIGFDDREVFDDALAPARGILVGLAITAACLLIAALVLGLSWSNARAQAGQPSNCSGTAASTAAAVTFPTSGETGPTSPAQFVTISNPSATATLWVCAVKGCTATANGAGSVALGPVGGVGVNGISWWRPAYPPPQTISILSSAATSPFTCAYQ